MLNRRELLISTGIVAATFVLPLRAQALPAPTVAALGNSGLIYITRLGKDGAEGRCQAEVWFVHADDAAYVVTDSKSWRVRAIRSGNDGARLWVGEFGPWHGSDGKYRTAPTFDAQGEIVADAATHARVLAIYGGKYPAEWSAWGPRFRDGLAEGSRAMLRYRPV